MNRWKEANPDKSKNWFSSGHVRNAWPSI